MKATDKQVVLVVEDDPVLNRAYLRLLQRAGYNVHTAHNGADALTILSQITPALILLDLQATVKANNKFLRQYTATDKEASPPIVIFTDHDQQAAADEAYRLGVEHYIVKKWTAAIQLLQLTKHGLSDA